MPDADDENDNNHDENDVNQVHHKNEVDDKKEEESTTKNNVSPNDRRDHIYNYIQDNPGTHLRKIIKDLGLGMGNTQYHLDKLESQGRIKSQRIYLRKHYYPAAVVSEPDAVILAFLKQESARDILIYLVEHTAGSTQTDIANFMHFTAPTIHWHMSRMIEANIVTSIKDGKTVKYHIKADRLKDIAYFLKAYHPDIWTRLSDRLAELFLELSSSAAAKEEGGEEAY